MRRECFSADELEYSSPTTYIYIFFLWSLTSSHMILKEATRIKFLKRAQQLCTLEASLRSWLLSLQKASSSGREIKGARFAYVHNTWSSMLKKKKKNNYSVPISNCMSKTYLTGLTEQTTNQQQQIKRAIT